MKRLILINCFTILNLLFSNVYIANSESLDPIIQNNYNLTEVEKINVEWAEKLKAGGYILHFRHAQREQWIDVATFDAFELFNGLDASKSTFSRATCLTEQGKEEAKMLGRVMKVASIKFQEVISSPSCRARQTSKIAFKRIDRISSSLLHRSAIPKSQHLEFDLELRTLLLDLKLQEGKNIALVGHVDTLKYQGNTVLDKSENSNFDVERRDPTGFVILEKVGSKVFARHIFQSMKDFSLAILKVPLSNPEVTRYS